MGMLEHSQWLTREINKKRSHIVAAIVATAFSNFFAIFTSLFVMVVYNKIIPNSALSTLVTVMTGVLVLIASDTLLKFLKGRIINSASAEVEKTLQEALYEKVISWDLQKVPKLSGSSATLVKDLENIIELFTSTTINVLVGLPFIIIYLLVIFLIGYQIAYVSLALILIVLGVNLVFYFLVQGQASSSKNSFIEKSSQFIETLSNLETIKSIGDYSFFGNKWGRVVSQNNEAGFKLKDSLADVSTLNGAITSLGQILIVSVGAYLVINEEITTGALIASILLNGRAQQPVMQLSGLIQKIATAAVSKRKLDHVFNSVSSEEVRRENLKLKRVEGDILIKDLNYSIEDTNVSILDVPGLRIRENEKIGIVGSVGSGKSTLLKLIAGVYTPTSGAISIGNYNISAINQTVLRDYVGYLGQTPGIFSGTIRENICLTKKDATDEEIDQALKLSGFDRILAQFPNGLAFKLSENGRELSGGQKQILALARSFLTNPKYVLLDEPTSAMDPRHEMLFIKNIHAMLKERTFIVVTHRKPILNLVDRIIVIENGRVVLDGGRDEVLKKFA
ncbi:peptidase domain-containing ABC transporter [Marinobacterium sp. xm-d-530]|uniref:peptidase domain-containing ABC transporter n=1 Tax=Marinobacterium sp. xm-d-530 TaxID=2497747 RepID=UPI001569C214|nr:ATP-binding cassette domain-containing protein [Marinobacterium sp. xm-d-530]NRQ01166.1 Toxin RTX-I translocation ATP-binding protein [Marinobacterium sp. xm-d-530]